MAKTSFEEYLSGGGLEAAANRGVADAISKLVAAGITPCNKGEPPVLERASIQAVNHRHHPDIVKQAQAMPPEVIAAGIARASLSRANSR